MEELVEEVCCCGVVKKKGCCGEREKEEGEVERGRGDNNFNTRIVVSQTSHNFSIELRGKKSREAKLRIMFQFNKHKMGE